MRRTSNHIISRKKRRCVSQPCRECGKRTQGLFAVLGRRTTITFEEAERPWGQVVTCRKPLGRGGPAATQLATGLRGRRGGLALARRAGARGSECRTNLAKCCQDKKTSRFGSWPQRARSSWEMLVELAAHKLATRCSEGRGPAPPPDKGRLAAAPAQARDCKPLENLRSLIQNKLIDVTPV